MQGRRHDSKGRCRSGRRRARRLVYLLDGVQGLLVEVDEGEGGGRDGLDGGEEEDEEGVEGRGPGGGGRAGGVGDGRGGGEEELLWRLHGKRSATDDVGSAGMGRARSRGM